MYSGIKAADPDGIWLVQGWMFIYSAYWNEHPERLKAYLDGVPDDKAIVLDLFADALPGWNRRESPFFGKKFIWCQLHNFGGTQGLAGRFPTLMTQPHRARVEHPQDMAGVGLTMEGIHQNSVVYDLLLEDAWRDEPEDISDFVHRWVRSRYGPEGATDDIQAAWIVLTDTAYDQPLPSPGEAHWGVTQSLIVRRPSMDMLHFGLNPTDLHYDPAEFAQAWKPFVDAVSSDGELSDTLRFDAVDVSRQVLSNLFIDRYEAAKDAFDAGDSDEFTRAATLLLELIRDVNTVLNTNERFMLGPWIADARSWGQDAEESDRMEFNARNQVTLWGPTGQINDYASKQWGGLVLDYHHERWRLWINFLHISLRDDEPYDEDKFNEEVLKFEVTWNRQVRSYPTQPAEDIRVVLREMYDKYSRLALRTVDAAAAFR